MLDTVSSILVPFTQTFRDPLISRRLTANLSINTASLHSSLTQLASHHGSSVSVPLTPTEGFPGLGPHGSRESGHTVRWNTERRCERRSATFPARTTQFPPRRSQTVAAARVCTWFTGEPQLNNERSECVSEPVNLLMCGQGMRVSHRVKQS